MKTDRRKILKPIIITIIITFSIVFIKKVDLNYIKYVLSGYPDTAPLIYIILLIILPIFFFPMPILVLPAGLIFGLINGTFYTLIGTFINSFIMFKLGAYIGKERAVKLINKIKSPKIKASLMTDDQKKIMVIFLILRLIPLVSYNIINYIAGLTNIRLINHLIVTSIGILPGTIAFINVGDKLADISSPKFTISIILLILLILSSMLILRRYIKDEKSNNSNSNI